MRSFFPTALSICFDIEQSRFWPSLIPFTHLLNPFSLKWFAYVQRRKQSHSQVFQMKFQSSLHTNPGRANRKEGRDVILIGALCVGRQREGRALMCSGLWITETDSDSREMQPCSTTIILRGSCLPERPLSWVLYSDVEMIFWIIHMEAKLVNGSII